jgi:hypothetical protein
MPHFRFNEGEIEVPDDWADKSVALFAVGSKQPPAVSFVITHDDLDGKELATFADEKLDDLSGQLQAFKLVEKRQIELSGRVALDAEFTWRSNVGMMYQRQTYVQHGPRILVFTATARREIREEHRLQIDAVLSSLKLEE